MGGSASRLVSLDNRPTSHVPRLLLLRSRSHYETQHRAGSLVSQHTRLRASSLGPRSRRASPAPLPLERARTRLPESRPKMPLPHPRAHRPVTPGSANTPMKQPSQTRPRRTWVPGPSSTTLRRARQGATTRLRRSSRARASPPPRRSETLGSCSSSGWDTQPPRGTSCTLTNSPPRHAWTASSTTSCSTFRAATTFKGAATGPSPEPWMCVSTRCARNSSCESPFRSRLRRRWPTVLSKWSWTRWLAS
mmetsp:Transcript_18247/g.43812  ORF Transcript_18247/g.43812 Transcript_18247/m.43812 type:complete len:249 (+) Transcript_18247:1075-1821(+)